jgi:tetratricopeptide (TPR) repeat protein
MKWQQFEFPYTFVLGTDMRRAVLIIAILAGVLCRNAVALNFTPSEFEWASWPRYCQARYTVSGAGGNSMFALRVAPSEVESWAGRLAGVWDSFHHYCAGVIVFERGRREKDAKWRKHHFERVISETTYTLERAKPEHPIYARILTLRARAFFELNNDKAAVKDIEYAISLHPAVSEPYAAWGLLLRKRGDLSGAVEILEQGLDASGSNPEMHYILGLILVEQKDYENAADHAAAAYRGGYPLPGLQRKLRDAGYTVAK